MKDLKALHGDRIEVHLDDRGRTLHVADLVSNVADGTELYMCGPIRLMDAVRRAWSDNGPDPTNLRYETFGNSGWYEAEPFEVHIPRLNFRTTVNSDESMLEALERGGVDTMSDCRRGECGLCQVKILELSGEVDHRDVFYSDRQKAPNATMCCCISRAVATRPDSTPGNPAQSALVTIDVP
ncbi:flavin reductase family protein [Kocuria marina]|uniref:flavin reductase family protein n=1 Tax=Kocuria marina TaxID=223184 RepID=UPI003800512C